MKRYTIYKALRDKTAELDYVKSIDLQKGQMVRSTQNYPFPLPALLVEISDILFSNLSEQHQQGDGIISIYLYLPLITDTLNGAEMEEETLQILNRFDDIYQTFEGFQIADNVPLNRIREYKPKYGKRYIEFQVDFATMVTDSKSADTKKAKPDPEIAGTFKF